MDIFQKFSYVSSYLHLRSFAWKRGCTISSKVKMPQGWLTHSQKLLQSSITHNFICDLKAALHFLWAVEFLATFSLQIDITLVIF